MPKYFGTDGIRGKAFDFLTEKLAFKIGQALKIAFKEDTVVIGCDTRASSMTLAHGVAYGALTRGLNVKFAGVVSTPMIAHYSKENSIIGIMITASHNPYTDNGIKIFDKGYKSNEVIEDIIEAYIDNDHIIFDSYGKFELIDDITVNYLKLYEKMNISKSSYKLGYDSAHGANYKISKEVIDKYFDNAIQIGANPNGYNINLDCGSTHLENIIKLVKDHNLDLGFSYDGDGDRLLVVDQEKVYDGDMLLYIIGCYLKDKNKLKNNTIVLTKMSNPGIIKGLKDKDIEVHLTDVGDKYVSKAIIENGHLIGGENSGHLLLTHLLHSGDGLLASLYITKILNETNKTLKELTKDLNVYPQKMVNIKNIDKKVLMNPIVVKGIENAKTTLGDNSLLLVRASGTEPLIRVTISHPSEALLDVVMNQLLKLIEAEGEK